MNRQQRKIASFAMQSLQCNFAVEKQKKLLYTKENSFILPKRKIMKKTLLTLSFVSAAFAAVYAENDYIADPFEHAIKKSNPGALKSLASVQAALSGAKKAQLIALAQEQVDAKKTAAISPVFKDWKSWGFFVLSVGQGASCIASIYKTIYPSDAKLPQGEAALKDTNNILNIAAQTTMFVGGLLLFRDMFKRGEPKSDVEALKKAEKTLKAIQAYPAAA